MKYYLVFCLVLLYIVPQLSLGASNERLFVDERVDSLFTVNFQKMTEVIEKNIALDDNTIDREFVILLTFLSGVDCKTTDYSGFCYFSENELILWKDWYDKNKYKLKWVNVERGLELIRKEVLDDQEWEELKNLISG